MELLNKAELVLLCKENNVKGYSKFNKDDLIVFLKEKDLDLINIESRKKINNPKEKKETTDKPKKEKKDPKEKKETTDKSKKEKKEPKEKKEKKNNNNKKDSSDNDETSIVESFNDISLNETKINDSEYSYLKIELISSEITSLKNKLDFKLPNDTTKINSNGQITSQGMSISFFIKTPKNNKDKLLDTLQNHYLDKNNDLSIEEETDEENNNVTLIYKQDTITLKICEDEIFDYFFST